MTDVSNDLFEIIDRQNQHENAATRRQLIKTTGAALAGAGVMGLATGVGPAAAAVRTSKANAPETILAVAATAEVLATIVNTLGPEKLGNKLDDVTARNVRAAAQQEKNHYEALTQGLGAKAVTMKIHVPDEIFESKENLLTALVVGDQVFVNAYLLGLTVFARQGTVAGSKAARYAGEIMATEAVHRALALQSLGRLGNDRVYAKFTQAEQVAGLPTSGMRGFTSILDAVKMLESVGFGFGKAGNKPGVLYDYNEISARTPTDPDVNTLTIA